MHPEFHPEHPLPRMFPLEQVYARREMPLDHAEAVRAALEPLRFRIRAGMRIGVAVGSRGITGLDVMVRAVVDMLKTLEAVPVLFPAMGSHGGANPEGQSAVLAGYGISASTLGVPVEAAMETDQLGTSEWKTPVHWSREAMKMDGILVVNRVKPHTDFRGRLGSGILKMLVVGLGKRAGASAFHRAAIQFGYEKVLRSYAKIILDSAPILGGLAIVENACHETDHLQFVPAERAIQEEEELFLKARSLMPGLPLDDLDLLIVDRMGKNISGAGMDPNIVGRGVHGYSTDFSTQTEAPRIKRIMVRDLTPESHGNAIGVGMADYTTSRLVRAMDPRTSFVNAITAMTMNGAKVPIHFETDREVIQWALSSLVVEDTRHARILRISDTLNLDRMLASEALIGEARSHERIRLLGEPESLDFDADGQLMEMF